MQVKAYKITFFSPWDSKSPFLALGVQKNNVDIKYTLITFLWHQK